MTEHTVLIIDDSGTVRSHIRGVLERSGFLHAIVAKDGLEGYKILVSRPIDVVLCDVNMPGLDGFKLLALVRSRPELREIPVIMLTAEGEVAQKVRALEAGAQDYLTKPVHDLELAARVKVHLDVRLLQRELRQKNEALEMLANTDGLTRLTTRRHFMEVAEVELLRAVAEGRPLALVLVDIDHFKQINDRMGHLMGDTIIRGVASVLKSDLRERDIAGRYGGEEFVVVLPDTHRQGAIAVAERYRKKVESLRVRDYLESPVPSLDPASLLERDVEHQVGYTCTISAGVATIPENRALRVEDLIQEADVALYQAKSSGRNRVCVAQE